MAGVSFEGCKTVTLITECGGVISPSRYDLGPINGEVLESLGVSDLELREREYGIWVGVEPNQKESK